jgi:hypothetical protein
MQTIATVVACFAAACGSDKSSPNSVANADSASADVGSGGVGGRSSVDAGLLGGGDGGATGDAGGSGGLGAGGGGADAGSGGAGAMVDAGGVVDAPVADAPVGAGPDAAPVSWKLAFNVPLGSARRCTCAPTEGPWSCAAQVDAALAGLCAGKGEGDSCSGLTTPGQDFPAFAVSSGKCIARHCCPGCWTGNVCRLRFESDGTIARVSTQKLMDYVSYPTGHDWHYFCGDGGNACLNGKGDQEGRRVCNIGEVPSDTCPDHIYASDGI